MAVAGASPSPASPFSATPHGTPSATCQSTPPRQACAVNGGAAVAVWGEAWELTQAHWVMNHDEPLVLGGFKPVLFATPFQRV